MCEWERMGLFGEHGAMYWDSVVSQYSKSVGDPIAKTEGWKTSERYLLRVPWRLNFGEECH